MNFAQTFKQIGKWLFYNLFIYLFILYIGSIPYFSLIDSYPVCGTEPLVTTDVSHTIL